MTMHALGFLSCTLVFLSMDHQLNSVTYHVHGLIVDKQLVPGLLEHSSSSENNGIKKLALSKENSTVFARKLLLAFPDNEGRCSKDNIVIFQGPSTPLPSGIPTYTVQVLNVCVAGCSISNIHVRCGWFSSARLINPKLFKRIAFDDCLVNNGDALGPGDSLSFEYANSFPYPLSVSSVSCI